MAHSDDFLSPRDHCEICGVELEDEIIIQEFADGSLARLCPECAAGAALTEAPDTEAPAEDAPPPRKRRLFSRNRGPAAEPEPFAEFEAPDAEARTRGVFDVESPVDVAPAARVVAPPAAAPPAAAPPVATRPAARAAAPAPPPADERVPAAAYDAADADQDILDKTRELLMPVADLIGLQGEMQSALERLAASLEQFAAEMLTDSQGKTTVINSRLQALERELEITRTRLRETESLLPATVTSEAAVQAEAMPRPEDVAPITLDSLIAESRAVTAAAGAAAAAGTLASPAAAKAARGAEAKATAEPRAAAKAARGAEAKATAEPPAAAEAAAEAAPAVSADTLPWTPEPEVAAPETAPESVPPASAEAFWPEAEEAEAAEPVPAKPARAKAERPKPEKAAPAPPEAAVGVWQAPAPVAADAQVTGTFAISEVQAAQRYYNESTFVDRIRDVKRSLGRPKASLVRLAGPEAQAMLTIFWDIVWYQYLIDLRRDLSVNTPRVVLHREGMDLDELAFHFREKNSTVNDDGRLDASELEVHLLSDPSTLITEMSPEQAQVLEDATEEIWEQRAAPEFKWDD